MEIQSGSIEAKVARDTEIDKKIRNFGKNETTGEIDKITCSTIVVMVDPNKLRNETDSTGTNSSGTNTGGICTALQSYEATTTIVIPAQNAVEFKLVDAEPKGKEEKEEKDRDEIGE